MQPKKEPNPYKYNGPLDPYKDKNVCIIQKRKDVNEIVDGINKGDYWVISGPRQIGKTTLYYHVKNELPEAHHIIIDFEIFSTNEENFYQWLIDQFISTIPSDPITVKNYTPRLKFINFLERFKPKEDKRIIIIFDEIDGLPNLKSFLKVWRKVYIERIQKNVLNKYSVIMAGSKDLIAQTIGPNSPFNIARKFDIKDFSPEESRELIEKSQQLKNKIRDRAKEYLIFQTSGHPQLLQHLCHILFDKTIKENRDLTVDDIDKGIYELYKSNSTLGILKENVQTNRELTELVKQILDKKKITYIDHQEFSSFGVGAIVEDKENKKFCTIRNDVYKKFLEDILQISPPPGKKSSTVYKKPISKNMTLRQKPRIFISYSHKDEKWKNLLSEHLKVLEPQETIFVWDDSKIKTGQDWYPEIEKNMNSADIAIFLISRHSLTSKFILRKEIPILLKRRENDGMIFFPILVGPCIWKRIEWLAKIQIWPRNGIPISKGNPIQRDERCVELVEELVELLKNGINGDNE